MLGVRDQYAFGRVFEHGGGQLQLFLHQMPFSDVPCDGQHAIDPAYWQWPCGELTQAYLAVATADMAAEIADKAVSFQQFKQAPSFIEVYPHAQVQGGVVQ
ncbi:hypothetical protein D3C84_1075570 [compost metagenome]